MIYMNFNKLALWECWSNYRPYS